MAILACHFVVLNEKGVEGGQGNPGRLPLELLGLRLQLGSQQKLLVSGCPVLALQRSLGTSERAQRKRKLDLCGSNFHVNGLNPGHRRQGLALRDGRGHKLEGRGKLLGRAHTGVHL